MIVLDASAALELLLNTDGGRLVADRIRDPQLTLHAPHLLSIEVAHVLRRLVATGEVRAARASLALDDLRALDLDRYDHELLLPRIWKLRDNLTAYDAAYVALAEALGATLLTFDERLARAPGNRATIELL